MFRPRIGTQTRRRWTWQSQSNRNGPASRRPPVARRPRAPNREVCASARALRQHRRRLRSNNHPRRPCHFRANQVLVTRSAMSWSERFSANGVITALLRAPERCARVAPLPIDCWLGWASVVEVSTTFEVLKADVGAAVDGAPRGSPAALQIASQRPANFDSRCA